MILPEELLLRWVGAGTSPVDWCEKNYTVTPHIAEFVNTISNILFLLVPPVFSRLWSNYARNVTRGIQVVWFSFVIIGLSSAYFHATLSLLGQLLDELCIMWVWMICYTLFAPDQIRPKFLRGNQQLFSKFTTILTILLTFSAFFHPAINSYCLFLMVVPTVIALMGEVQASKDPNIVRLGTFTLVLLSLAITSWMCDRFLCDVSQAPVLKMLHGLWHVLIFFATYHLVVFFSLVHALRVLPESRPILKYWPRGFLKLPYVYCQSDPHDKMF